MAGRVTPPARVRTLNGKGPGAPIADEGAYNIDALLAAEREVTGERPPLRWRGRAWDLPWDLPFEVTKLMGEGLIVEGLAVLLGDEVLTLDPPLGVKEGEFVSSAVVKAFGMDPGESSAS